eukprot:TRINITY_DN3737_c0_g1_i1.p2 TRINITY_DN3737_c0_g1~~TRINITY_DN3737_c0_g1_i1.p2  ORF type:complete len:137 (-),score=31.97 TRINITY_DN3737_c0_g1_i1:208-618(-)
MSSLFQDGKRNMFGCPVLTGGAYFVLDVTFELGYAALAWILLEGSALAFISVALAIHAGIIFLTDYGANVPCNMRLIPGACMTWFDIGFTVLSLLLPLGGMKGYGEWRWLFILIGLSGIPVILCALDDGGPDTKKA